MRGIHIAAFTLSIVFASSALAGMGWFATVGVSVDPGLSDEAGQVEKDFDDPGASSAGSDEFSLVRGALDTLNALRVLTTQTEPALERWGVPPDIAYGIGGIVSFSMTILIVQVIRGLRLR